MDYSESLNLTPWDVLRERERIVEVLKIPISNLVFSRFYCELFIQQHSIGYLSIDLSAANTHYDFGKASLQKLNWPKVFNIFEKELREKIARQIGVSSFNVIPASFRRLYIEDMDNQLIASFDCVYENSTWMVMDERILA